MNHDLFIDGVFVKPLSGEYFKVLNPFNGSVVGLCAKAGKDDIKKALNSALKARDVMRSLTPKERYDILMNAAELLHADVGMISLIASESGKPVKFVKGEVHATVERLKYAAMESLSIDGKVISDDSSNNRLAMVVYEPVGVVLAISPFNYPLFSGTSKVSEAVASGNSVILKPASDCPLCLIRFSKIMSKAGLPNGGLNTITGSGKLVGDELLPSKDINVVSFTGSSSAGKAISAASCLKNEILELGGKCPALVLSDCDVSLASKECVAGSFKLSGQRCDAISKVIVHKSIADDFIKKVLIDAGEFKPGDPLLEKTTIGPLINESALKHVDELVTDAVSKGARLLIGGKYKRLMYEPTILVGVTGKMRISSEEVFGPVLSVMVFDSDDEILSEALKSDYGLDASVFTCDFSKALSFARKLNEGSVHINRAPSHGVAKFPFGGNKKSGINREGVRESIYSMLRKKTIILNI